MNSYQKKWIGVLTQANITGWVIKDLSNDILIKVPDNKNIKELADHLGKVIAQLSLDIDLPKQRLKFVISNSREQVDYLLNPDEGDLNTGNAI